MAIVIVGLGMYVAGVKRSWGGLLVGGVGAGIGVAAMHYMGMAALRFPGECDYKTALVALSVVIAVVAATAALWFTLRVNGHRATVGASLVMAIAISGMHYTAMTAVTVRTVSGVATRDGVSEIVLVAPLVIGLGIEVLLVLFAVLMNPLDVVENVGTTERGEFSVPRQGNDAVPPATDPTAYQVPASGAHAFEAFGGAQGDPHYDYPDYRDYRG
jgi:hypothetical protein